MTGSSCRRQKNANGSTFQIQSLCDIQSRESIIEGFRDEARERNQRLTRHTQIDRTHSSTVYNVILLSALLHEFPSSCSLGFYAQTDIEIASTMNGRMTHTRRAFATPQDQRRWRFAPLV
mmetsp:Transcript_16605/g.45978  ORF Transcript_16605/g.45978 Transcript_16605/m.45978 type:complete len:120 (-) Transcript_16605:611-970(-)